MQKIVIKNFGPIRDAEIEIQPITVLLGEQATGKSTVAQLVHFFNSLIRDWLIQFTKRTGNWNAFDVENIMLGTVQAKFKSYYGYKIIQTTNPIDIKYYFNYSNEKYIHVKSYEQEDISISFSEACGLTEFCERLAVIVSREELFFSSQRRTEIQDLLTSFLTSNGREPFSSSVYLIAGRNITTSFPKAFESFFTENYQEGIEEAGEYKSVHLELMSQFIQYSARTIDVISQHGGSIESLFALRKVTQDDIFSQNFLSRLYSILKGKYTVSGSAESLKIDDSYHKIPLNQTSSGQQESIRILQDLAIACAINTLHFRTIEEPEAHLFPSAQNALTELIVMTHNRTGSHFLMTTHSPYFLSSFNNLLYAAKAAGDNMPVGETPNQEHIKRVEELGYQRHLRLLSKDFAAYQLQNGTAESIYNPAYAITKIDGLDAVSSEIGDKFESLVEIIREAEEYEAA